LGGEFLLVSDSDWDRRVITRTFLAVGQSIPQHWQFQNTPGNFTKGTQRNVFNDEMAAFFLRHPERKPHPH